MPNKENLRPKPFKKGESGNPNGRPKGSLNRSTVLKKWLSVKTSVKNPATDQEEKATVEDQIILALIKEAASGNVQAIKEIQDTMHGKIKDEIQSDGKMKIEIEYL